MINLRVLRLALAILLLWLIGAGISWVMFDPQDTLVGARSGGGGTPPVYDLAPSDLSEATDQLSKTALWGLQRDGSERPPPSALKGVEVKKIVWRILAAVSKGQERYVVIQIDKGAPASVKEGESLPDGSRLLHITPSKLTVMTAEDEQQTINLNL